MPVFATGVSTDRAGRAATERGRAVRVPAFPADRDPPSRPRGSDHSRGSRTPGPVLHDLLFHRQKALEDGDLQRYAAELELDVARFDRDRSDAEVQRRIRRDVESGLASGEVRGTPTLFIDGVVHRGGYDAATLIEELAG
jgi:glutaredoxin